MPIPEHISKNIALPVIGAPLFLPGNCFVIAHCKAGIITAVSSTKCQTSRGSRGVDYSNQK